MFCIDLVLCGSGWNHGIRALRIFHGNDYALPVPPSVASLKDKGRRSALIFKTAHLSSWCRSGWFNAVAEPDSKPLTGTL